MTIQTLARLQTLKLRIAWRSDFVLNHNRCIIKDMIDFSYGKAILLPSFCYSITLPFFLSL